MFAKFAQMSCDNSRSDSELYDAQIPSNPLKFSKLNDEVFERLKAQLLKGELPLSR